MPGFQPGGVCEVYSSSGRPVGPAEVAIMESVQPLQVLELGR